MMWVKFFSWWQHKLKLIKNWSIESLEIFREIVSMKNVSKIVSDDELWNGAHDLTRAIHELIIYGEYPLTLFSNKYIYLNEDTY